MLLFVSVSNILRFLITNRPVTLVVCFISLQSIVFGCTCYSPQDAEQALDFSNYAGTFKVVSVEKNQPDESGKDRGIRSARLSVTKVYKGSLKVGQELNFKQGGGADCLFVFDDESVGQELLLYLDAGALDEGLWRARICTRSNSVEFAAADILYLDGRSKRLGRTRLAGQATYEIQSAVVEIPDRIELLVGTKITVTGRGRTITLKTDEKGVFEIYDLPPGKYFVRPEPVTGYRIYDEESNSVEVEVKKGEHTNQNLRFEIDNRIRFKAIREDGTPFKGCFELEPTFGTRSGYWESWANECAEVEGIVEFQTVPEGAYLIFNDDDKNQPIYYPGVTDRSKAVPVRIGPGEFIDDLIFTMPVRKKQQPLVELPIAD